MIRKTNDRGIAMRYSRLALPAEGGVSYNLFRRRSAPDLHCAVAQPHPVPAFIDGETWEFAGAVRGERDAPRGFRAPEARLGTRLNGFYLFFAHAPRRPDASRA
jgi:hypothetical protein